MGTIAPLEPCGVCPLGGTRQMTVACEGRGVLVRGLGCYGETAASRMLHPNRLRRNTHADRDHADLSFVSYDPRSGQ
jgi:hypothetical protein